MEYAFYIGCTAPVKALKYDISTRVIAKKLGIKLTDIPEFGCCGYPVKSMDLFAALVMSARNLALAEERGFDIIGICTGCMATLSEAKIYLEDEIIRDKVNKKLRAIGVREYSGKVKVKHLARFLYEDYGLTAIKEKLTRTLEPLRFGIHYGCHYMKPSHAYEHFDNPDLPVTLDKITALTGAVSMDYENKNQCCGLTIMGTAEDIGVRLASEKLKCLTDHNADAMVLACPSCCIAYENNQRLVGKKTSRDFNLPVLYFTQILGLAMGLSENELGFEHNRVMTDSLLDKLRSR